MAKPCNLFVSYSEKGDIAARKEGYAFVGRAMLITGQEVKVYRKWKLKFKKKKK